MKLLLVILGLELLCSGQVIQSNASSSSGTANTCALPYSVTSGDILVVSKNWESSTNTPAVSSSHVTTWTQGRLDTANAIKIAIYVGLATSSGAETITMSVSGSSFDNIRCAEFSGAATSATVDVANSAGFSGSPASVSSSVTTTINGDTLIGSIGGFRSVGTFNAGSVSQSEIAATQGADSGGMLYRFSGTNGAVATSFGNSGNDQGAIAVVALKPPAGITITSSATAPDGVSGTAYSYQLAAVGGVGAYTWSITVGSLQSGLSLSSAGLISGTPTATGSKTVTVSVTDGTSTKTQSLTLGVGSSFATGSVVQSQVNGTLGLAGFSAFASNVTVGNLLVVACGTGFGFSGTLVATPTDSLSTPFRFIGTWTLISGSANGYQSGTLYSGIAPSTGSDTVNCATNQNAFVESELSGVDSLPEINSISSGSAASVATFTSAIVTPAVAREVIWGLATGFTAAGTMAVNSPFTSAGTQVPTAAGFDVVSSTSGVTPSWTQTGNTNGQWAALVTSFRVKAASIPAFTFVPQLSLIVTGP